jgi:two-component system, NtrC family, nitrogen regulation response regulator NtrX
MPQILIVDDNRIILQLLLKELTHANFQVQTLNNIGLIWKNIRETRPNLVLLGLHSEGFNSWQVLDEIKKKIPDLPVMIYAIKGDCSINSLKQAINEVLKNGSISSAFMFHAIKKTESEQVKVE